MGSVLVDNHHTRGRRRHYVSAGDVDCGKIIGGSGVFIIGVYKPCFYRFFAQVAFLHGSYSGGRCIGGMPHETGVKLLPVVDGAGSAQRTRRCEAGR